MRYVDNIHNDTYGYYGIDLGYIPSTHTSVRIKGLAAVDGALYFGCGPSYVPYGGWFRLFTYMDNYMVFDCPQDSDWRAEMPTDLSHVFDLDFGFKEIEGSWYLYIHNNDTDYEMTYPASTYQYNFTDTLKCWGNASDFEVAAGSRFYDIQVFESGVLTAHYVPVYDDVYGAGMYDEIGQQAHYAIAGSETIGYDNLIAIEYSGGTSVIFESSGGSLSARIKVNEDCTGTDHHWGIKQLSNTSAGSACTISYNGQTGLTEFSGKTDGVYDFDYVMEPWSGSSADSRYRVAIFHITMYDDITGEPYGYEDLVQRLRQKNDLNQGKPLYLGTDEVNTMYLGTDEVIAAYLGEDLVFDAGSVPPIPPVPPVPPTPPASKVLTITDMGVDTGQTKGITMYNNASGSVYPQVNIDIYDDGIPNITEYESGYTITSASDYSFVVEGPFTDNVEISAYYDDCGSCQSSYTLTFVNDSASTAHAGSGLCDEIRTIKRIVIEDIPYGDAFMGGISNAVVAIEDDFGAYWDITSNANNADIYGCGNNTASADTLIDRVSFIVETKLTDNIHIFFAYNDEDGGGCHVDEPDENYYYTFSEGETALTISYPTIYCNGECDYDTCSGDPECLCNCGGGQWMQMGPDDGVCECMDADDPDKCGCISSGNEWVVPEIGEPYCQQVCHDNDPQCNCEKNGGSWVEVGPDEWVCECMGADDYNKCECEKQGHNFYWDSDNQICRNRAVEDCEEQFPADDEGTCGCLGGIWDDAMWNCDCQGDPDCESRFQPPV